MRDVVLAPPKDLFSYTEQVTDPQSNQSGQCYLRTAGGTPFPFRSGFLPTMLANPTTIPVDNVHMSITKLIYKDDVEAEPSLVEGQPQELEIGTCRARLYIGINDFSFNPGDHKRLAYRIMIFTRYETWTEIVKLKQKSTSQNGQIWYCEDVTVFRGGNEPIVHFADDCD